MEHKDVKNQQHYAQAVQPIEYMEITMTPEQYEGYLLGNVIKYISRYRHKNGLEDLRKGKVYMAWLVDHVADIDERSEAATGNDGNNSGNNSNE